MDVAVSPALCPQTLLRLTLPLPTPKLGKSSCCNLVEHVVLCLCLQSKALTLVTASSSPSDLYGCERS